MTEKLKIIEKKLQSLNRRKVESVEKVDLLNQMAEQFTSGDESERMLKVSEESTELARRLNYKKGEANSLSYMGFAQWLLSQHKKATKNLLKAKSLFKKIDDSDGAAKNLVSLAGLYRSLGDYDQAILFSLDALQYFRKHSVRLWEAVTLLNLGYTYELIGDHERSLQHHLALLKIKFNHDEEWLAGRALNGIGVAYQNMGKPERALGHYKESLKLFNKMENKRGRARALNDLGTVYQLMGDYTQAYEFYSKSLIIREEVYQGEAECTSLINLGKLFVLQKNSVKAKEFLEKAISIATKIKAKAKVYQAHQALAEAFELDGDFPNVVEHYKAFHQIKEEVFSEASNTRIKNLQTKVEVEKSEKDAEITRLRNVELKEKNVQLKQLLNELKTAQTQLVQSEKMAALGKITAGITHEINSPIGAIKSNADVAIRCVLGLREIFGANDKIDKSRDFQKFLKILEDNNRVSVTASNRIVNIVSSLKNFTRLDAAEFEKVNIHEGLDSALTLIQHEIKNGIIVEKDYGEIPDISCYPSELNQVFMTLLRNAVQAIEHKGSVTIRTSIGGKGRVFVEISDTGKGMPPDQLKSIFELSFTTKGVRIGMGMGLINAYNIIQKHKGELSVESEVGKGSAFLVSLPTKLQKSPKTA